MLYQFKRPMIVAARSKSQICGHSSSGSAGSNPASGLDVCVVCVVQQRQKAKCGTVQTKKEVRIKYKERTRERK
jgi:hypothetical protein